MTQEKQFARWTFADQVSTYRFWGLLAAWILVAASGSAFSALVPSISRDVAESMMSLVMWMSAGRASGFVVGVFLAYLAVQWRTVHVLMALTAAYCASCALLIVPTGLPILPMVALCGFLQGVTSLCFLIAIPAILSDGRGGRFEFVTAFALMYASLHLGESGIGMPVAFALQYLGLTTCLIGITFFLAAAVLFLLPVRRCLFDEAPRMRHVPLAPRRREPVGVAVFSALPFAGLLFALLDLSGIAAYLGMGMDSHPLLAAASIGALLVLGLGYVARWCYRAHGETAFLMPSQQLLTPRASAWIALCVPFGLPLLLMTLGKVLNERADGLGRIGRVSLKWLAVGCLFMPPLAIALIQHALNEAATAPAADSV